MKDNIVESVKAEFDMRSQRGISKYGTTLAGNHAELTERIQHLKEELMDGCLYCEWILQRLKKYEDDGK